jgi:hypothetical protein
VSPQCRYLRGETDIAGGHIQGRFFATIFESHVNIGQLLKTVRFPIDSPRTVMEKSERLRDNLFKMFRSLKCDNRTWKQNSEGHILMLRRTEIPVHMTAMVIIGNILRENYPVLRLLSSKKHLVQIPKKNGTAILLHTEVTDTKSLFLTNFSIGWSERVSSAISGCSLILLFIDNDNYQ